MGDYTEIDRKLDEFIDSHTDEIVAAAQKLIQIPSVEGTPTSDAPFGIETRMALENVLNVAQSYGFTTKMLDGYAAHAQFGAGEDLIGVLSHVDVVPAGSDWVHDPFGGVSRMAKSSVAGLSMIRGRLLPVYTHSSRSRRQAFQ